MTEKKNLVVYFSRADENYNVGTVEVGNTELLAHKIAETVGADEFKIMPVKSYPTNYMETVDIATSEKESNARPEYVGDIEINDYDTIYLGYPIWWGDLPMIVYSFLEKHNFTNKKVAPFCTHEGSGQAGTFDKLAKVLDGAEVLDGLEMTGSRARTDQGLAQAEEWVQASK